VIKKHCKKLIRDAKQTAHVKIIKEEVRRDIVPRSVLTRIVEERKELHKEEVRKHLIHEQTIKIQHHYKDIIHHKITIIKEQNKVITPAVQQEIQRVKSHYKNLIITKIHTFTTQVMPPKVHVTECATRALDRFTQTQAVRKCGYNKRCRSSWVQKYEQIEHNFRTVSLNTCNCARKSKCAKSLAKCQKACMKTACRIRSTLKCKNGRTTASSYKVCRRIHKIK